MSYNENLLSLLKGSSIGIDSNYEDSYRCNTKEVLPNWSSPSIRYPRSKEVKSKNVLRTLIATTLTVGTWLPISSASAAIVPVTLGKAGNFAITSTGGFTNTGLSSINGDLGLTGTLSYIDSGLATLKGDYHFGDSSAVASALEVKSY